MATPEDEHALWQIAFGGRPGDRVPQSDETPHGAWLRAVALGGQGWYASARARLDTVVARVPPTDPVHALALVTRASFMRQVGDHASAAELDGRAFVAAVAASHREARCDALTGLAADALGCGRLDLSDGLLARAHTELAGDSRCPGELTRARIRFHWVRGEVALARARFDSASEDAATALALAEEFGSVRHVVKSRLLVAAALTGTSHAAAAAAGVEVMELGDEYHLLPLVWAAAMLVAGVNSGTQRGVRADRVRADAARVLARRGGRFRR